MLDGAARGLDQIRSDIRFIGKVSQETPDIHDLRRLSAILRRLVNEDLLVRSWKFFGGELPKQMHIRATSLRNVRPQKGDRHFAGGGRHGHLSLSGIMFAPRYASPQEIEALQRRTMEELKQGKPALTDFPLNEYKSSSSIIVDELRISRQQVIAFEANKRGGVHLEPTGKNDKIAYRTLDELASQWKIGGESELKPLDPVSYEILCIAQNISDSPDVQRLLEKIDDTIDV